MLTRYSYRERLKDSSSKPVRKNPHQAILTESRSKIVPVSWSGRILTRNSYRKLLKDCSSKPSGRILTSVQVSRSGNSSLGILTGSVSKNVKLTGRILTRYSYRERLKDFSNKLVRKNPHQVFLQGASQRLFQ